MDADVSWGMSIWGPECLMEEEEQSVPLCDSRRAKSRATRRFARKLCAIVVKFSAILRSKSAVVVVIRMRTFSFSICLCFFWFGFGFEE